MSYGTDIEGKRIEVQVTCDSGAYAAKDPIDRVSLHRRQWPWKPEKVTWKIENECGSLIRVQIRVPDEPCKFEFKGPSKADNVSDCTSQWVSVQGKVGNQPGKASLSGRSDKDNFNQIVRTISYDMVVADQDLKNQTKIDPELQLIRPNSGFAFSDVLNLPIVAAVLLTLAVSGLVRWLLRSSRGQ